MNAEVRTMLSVRLFCAALVAALLLPPITSAPQASPTFFGSGGLSNTAPDVTNMAFGYQALMANTAGGENTAIGYQALLNNNTSQNTAIGFQALTANTGGAQNTAIGLYALAANTGGYFNTATGAGSLQNNTTGQANTATGTNALFWNTTGFADTAYGMNALVFSTTGGYNTALGFNALYHNTTGSNNIATGPSALFSNTTGNYNIAIGNGAGSNNTAGYNNIAIGNGAGSNNTVGYNNIDIGHPGSHLDHDVIRIGTSQHDTRIAGINGTTVSGGVAVYILPSGQLGTLTSSRRFKHDIRDMSDISEKLMQLRPVAFRYNDSVETGPHHLQYGLIAEEVARVFPNLVQYDKAGRPFTIYYHLLTPMLLNELQQEHRQAVAQRSEIVALKQAQTSEIAAQNSKIGALQAALDMQRAELALLKHTQHRGSGTYALLGGLGLTGAAFLRRRRTR